jgi:phosphoinositide-3-kinase, regulatory subunit 4
MYGMQAFNGSKAAPETGTTPANAIGILESSANPLSSRTPSQQPLSDLRTRAAVNRPQRPIHSYSNTPQPPTPNPRNFYLLLQLLTRAAGNDPNILAILDKFYKDSHLQSSPSSTPKPLPPPHRMPLRPPSSRPHNHTTWHPEGTLIAHLTEHTAPINRVLPSPDHTFFLTASDDGTVKVWDTVRLEKNVVNRARLTHRHGEPGGAVVKVKAVCFVEGTYGVVSAGDDGSLHYYGIEYSVGTLTPKYGKIKVSKTYQLEQGEYAVWLESYRQGTQTTPLQSTTSLLKLTLREITSSSSSS